MPGYLYERLIPDTDFIQKVRRYRPSSLLPLIADAGAQYWEKNSCLASPDKKLTPWALADNIARVSLVMGNEYRQDATPRDLRECAAAYVAIEDPELSAAQPDTVDGFLLRKASEQLVVQQSNFHELGRSAALFEQTAPPRALKVIQPGWDQQLFGCSLSEYVGIGFIVHTAAVKNQGRFSPQWLDDPSSNDLSSRVEIARQIGAGRACNGQRAASYVDTGSGHQIAWDCRRIASFAAKLRRLANRRDCIAGRNKAAATSKHD